MFSSKCLPRCSIFGIKIIWSRLSYFLSLCLFLCFFVSFFVSFFLSFFLPLFLYLSSPFQPHFYISFLPSILFLVPPLPALSLLQLLFMSPITSSIQSTGRQHSPQHALPIPTPSTTTRSGRGRYTPFWGPLDFFKCVLESLRNMQGTSSNSAGHYLEVEKCSASMIMMELIGQMCDVVSSAMLISSDCIDFHCRKLRRFESSYCSVQSSRWMTDPLSLTSHSSCIPHTRIRTYTHILSYTH